MVKDTLFKSLLIPLLGIVIPIISNLVNFKEHSTGDIIASNILFIATSYIIWQGSVKIISIVRNRKVVKQNVFFKIFFLCTLTAAYGFTVAVTSALLWQQLFLGTIIWPPAIRCGLVCLSIVLFLTLVYETLFLSKERELDIKVVNQLDKDRIFAEVNILKSELDPHFLFNSLTTLSFLIASDAERAQRFTQKLAQVYKYVLVNKDKDFVPLAEELDFIENYNYLLQIRFLNNVQLAIEKDCQSINAAAILPCSLQMLIENAIKHNAFNNSEPLLITITLNANCITVKNNTRPKLYPVESTKVGLRNLKARYQLLCNKDIAVHRYPDKFVVKLPLIKNQKL